MAQIREIQHDEIDLLIEHFQRHFREPGVGGIIAQPYSETEPYRPAENRARILKRWTTPHTQGPWEKTWVLVDQEKIVGHIELMGLGKPVLSHRAKLGIGIETSHRSNGYGKALVRTAIAWARQTEFLEWIDLDVFDHNKAAIQLYKQLGFICIGKTPDRLRVAGQKIDDLHMVLSLKDTERANSADHSALPPVQVHCIEQLTHHELSTKYEKLSQSAVLTDALDFRDLFVHHEIIPPGRRSSSPHSHSHIEEMFLVLEGQPTLVYGNHRFQAKPGDYIGFAPNDRNLHYVINETDTDVKILGICSEHPLDQTHYGSTK
jgi:uncharacterized cupin superfamily protein/RimJ/RimL family protein N-acetyltransferase